MTAKMSDNKLNLENLSGGKDDSNKSDLADISFKKSDSVSEKKKEPDFSSAKPKAETKDNSNDVDEKKDIKKPLSENMAKFQDTQKKSVPDLNLKGIKVDLADDSSDVISKPTEKKAAERIINKPIQKAEKKQPASKPEIKKSDSFMMSEKGYDKKPDIEDGQKTMVMKDTSAVNKTDNKSYIKSDSKAGSSVKKNKKKKKKNNQSSFNNSIFGGFFLAFGIVVAAFIVAIGGISLGKEYLGIDKAENDITFNIPQGSTSADIAEMLEENQIISNKLLFRLALKLNAPDMIYPGDITLQPAMGYSAIIEQLGTMRETYETTTISFPEGVTLLEVAQLLEEKGVCKADEFLFEFNKSQGYDFEKLISGNEDAFYHMEGYFFPDTYDFYLNDTGYNITKIVREHFAQKFTDKMIDKMEKSKLNMNQVMILASMVQWESGTVEDMPKVASVFLNRLHDPDTFPSFQSDATEKYIDKVIKAEADTKAELEHYTEGYDTYNYKGLPSGPVCNPGLDAINAVLNPEDTDYYYFCNNLKTGESFFASTLEEHEVNLEKAGLK